MFQVTFTKQKHPPSQWDAVGSTELWCVGSLRLRLLYKFSSTQLIVLVYIQHTLGYHFFFVELKKSHSKKKYFHDLTWLDRKYLLLVFFSKLYLAKTATAFASRRIESCLYTNSLRIPHFRTNSSILAHITASNPSHTTPIRLFMLSFFPFFGLLDGILFMELFD